jgi:alkylation response protein AidB-like acyl-CoA dehydrogenase
MNTPGLVVGQTNDMLGLRAAEAVDLLLTDCRVPKANLLGGLHEGFSIAREVVEGGRIDIAAQAVGIGEACLEQSLAKAKSRKQFGRPIAEFEAIQWMVADMSTEIDAARLLMFSAAAMRAATLATVGSRWPLRWPSSLPRKPPIAPHTKALQIFGGHGYLTEYPVERLYRDARAMTLYEETSEIERLVIERELARA